MKLIIKYALLLSIVFTTIACGDDSDKVVAPNRTDYISYAMVRGNWMLTQIDGVDVPESSYVYMTLSRKDELQWFKIYENMNSAFSSKSEGAYNLVHDKDNGKTSIWGYYENQLGAIWNSSYEISSLTETTMIWIMETTKEVHTYTKISEIPEDILAGKVSI